MTENNQIQLGKTLWNIADQLRGAMNADNFRDYMLAFLFRRHLSDNYEAAAKRELGSGYLEIAALTAAQTQKLSTLPTHKKALIQQLFPSPEEADNILSGGTPTS